MSKEEMREKLTNGLGYCSKDDYFMHCPDCPYNCYGGDCLKFLIKDAFDYISEVAE